MRLVWLRLLTLLAVALCADAGQPSKPQSQPRATVSGVFVGRSGKPMAKAHLFLGEVLGDQVLVYSRIKLVAQPPYAIADDKGRFVFPGVAPGKYTIVYQPAGVTAPVLAEFGIKSLAATTRSTLPLLRGIEIGSTGEPLPERRWGQEFTLLKGHVFYGEGADMKIWNATIRKGQAGPFLEVRRGFLWHQELDGKSPINLQAWSY